MSIRVKNLNLRVWFWLRTNAGGMLKTCKSSGVYWELAFDKPSGGRVSNAWATCLIHRDTNWKRLLIPNMTTVSHDTGVKGFTGMRWARVWLACWWGNGLPRRRSVADLRGWSATLELRYGPDSYGRQQSGILGNGGNSDPAIPRGGWRFSDCKLLL